MFHLKFNKINEWTHSLISISNKFKKIEKIKTSKDETFYALLFHVNYQIQMQSNDDELESISQNRWTDEQKQYVLFCGPSSIHDPIPPSYTLSPLAVFSLNYPLAQAVYRRNWTGFRCDQLLTHRDTDRKRKTTKNVGIMKEKRNQFSSLADAKRKRCISIDGRCSIIHLL